MEEMAKSPFCPNWGVPLAVQGGLTTLFFFFSFSFCPFF
jgi:hypothetical protein